MPKCLLCGNEINDSGHKCGVFEKVILKKEKDQSCPWCHHRFGLHTFGLQFEGGFGLSNPPQKVFPCPKCGKSIKRENDLEATKKASRKAIWLFLIPLGAWFVMSRICHITTATTPAVVISLAIASSILFRNITDYRGQILKKAE